MQVLILDPSLRSKVCNFGVGGMGCVRKKHVFLGTDIINSLADIISDLTGDDDGLDRKLRLKPSSGCIPC